MSTREIIENGNNAQPLTEVQAAIVRLWNGGKSGLQVATELGITRSSVLGHIKRLRNKGYDLRAAPLNLVKKVKGDAPPPPRKKKEIINKLFDNGKEAVEHEVIEILQREIVVDVKIEPANEGDGILLTDLRMLSCRAIVSDEGDHIDWRYCGATITSGKGAYCNGHRAIYYQPLPKKNRQNMNINGIRKIHK